MELYHLVLGPISTNTYIIKGTDGAIVIDPAGEYDKIKETIKKIGVNVKYVLLTHAHFDHCGAAAALQRDGASVYMGKKDAELFAVGGHLATPDMNLEMFKPDFVLYGGEKLNLSGIEFEVISTPGHTAGGMTYVTSEGIFCGDTLFRQSIGRTDLPSGNYAEIIKSVKKLLSLPNECTVYPGHGQFTTLAYERENNPYV